MVLLLRTFIMMMPRRDYTASLTLSMSEFVKHDDFPSPSIRCLVNIGIKSVDKRSEKHASGTRAGSSLLSPDGTAAASLHIMSYIWPSSSAELSTDVQLEQ